MGIDRTRADTLLVSSSSLAISLLCNSMLALNDGHSYYFFFLACYPGTEAPVTFSADFGNKNTFVPRIGT